MRKVVIGLIGVLLAVIVVGLLNPFKSKYRKLMNEAGHLLSKGDIASIKMSLVKYKEALDIKEKEILDIIGNNTKYLEGETFNKKLESKLISTSQDRVECIYKIAGVYKAMGIEFVNALMFNEAILSLTRASVLLPNDKLIYYYLAVSFANLWRSKIGDNNSKKFAKKAIDYYNRAIKIDPKFLDAIYGLAIIKAHIGEYEDAKTLARRVMVIDYDGKFGYHEKAMLALAMFCIKSGDKDSAKKYINILLGSAKEKKIRLKARELLKSLQ